MAISPIWDAWGYRNKLAFAAPLNGVDGWHGLFVFAVAAIEGAKALVATDPLFIKGEKVTGNLNFYGSAGLIAVNDLHKKLVEAPIRWAWRSDPGSVA